MTLAAFPGKYGKRASRIPVSVSLVGAGTGSVSDNFDWRHLRGLGELLAYEFKTPFQRKEPTRWIRRRAYRRRSSPFR